MNKVSLIYITCPNNLEAKRVGRMLVEEKLVACVNIIDSITSIFRYEDKICEEQEVLMIAKTTSTQFNKIKTRVAELHSYDAPCILEIPIGRAEQKFHAWIQNSIAL